MVVEVDVAGDRDAQLGHVGEDVGLQARLKVGLLQIFAVQVEPTLVGDKRLTKH